MGEAYQLWIEAISPSYTPRKIETRCGKIPSDCFSWATREPLRMQHPNPLLYPTFHPPYTPSKIETSCGKYSWIAFDGRLERGLRFYQGISKVGVWRFPTYPQGLMGMFKCHNEFAYLKWYTQSAHPPSPARQYIQTTKYTRTTTIVRLRTKERIILDERSEASDESDVPSANSDTSSFLPTRADENVPWSNNLVSTLEVQAPS